MKLVLAVTHLTIQIVRKDSSFFITVEKDGQLEPPQNWKRLVFNRHEESFYGLLVEEKNGGILLNSWQLMTLLAKEGFNRFIHWNWNETGQICLAAAHSMFEAIDKKEWIPDFTSFEKGKIRWQLPERVKNEFGQNFWEQTVEGMPVESFMTDWFNGAMEQFFNKNKAWQAIVTKRLEALQRESISKEALQEFFADDIWSEWVGMTENTRPFTIGLRLEEPADIDGTWNLDVFLQGKKNPPFIVDLKDDSNMPNAWKKHLEDVEKELGRIGKLFPWLKGKNGLQSSLTESEAWLFLTEVSETLLALGMEILLPSWWQAMKNAQMKVKAKLKGAGGARPSFVGLNTVLNYDWRFSMNGVELSEEEFQRLVEEKRRLVYIQGRWIKLDPKFIRQIQELLKRAEKEGLHVRELIEQELVEKEKTVEDESDQEMLKVQFELNRQWKEMIHALKDMKKIPLQDVPRGFNGDIRPYQKLGFSWLLFLRKFGFGACLADDMGLGKTIQLISYLLAVKEKEKEVVGPALIICPTSVLGNWQKEIERFAPELKVYLHYGPGRLKEEAFEEAASQADVVLTSYALAHLDERELLRLHWSSITIDEAQNIKNAQTKQSRAVRKLKGQHHIALTGTPMENRLAELWAIFDFINHGYLGSFHQFQKRFVLPIEKDDDKEKVRELQALIRPFLLRRTKKDEEVSLNLPDKQEQKEYCPLTKEQAALYEQLVQDTFDQIEQLTGIERKGLVLQLLGRLKQLCNHPALYLKEEEPKQIVKRSMKMEKLIEIVDAVLEQEESCLIFTQYIEMGEMIRTALETRFGITVPFLNGSVSKKKRDELIAKFQEREFPVFILSLKAGGTGLNLTAANHVIHYDRWWNPAVENQATDRAYRIGQKRFVHVHKFITTGTLEEKIDAMLEKKQSLNEQIIQSDNWITELSTEELKELISLT